MANNAIELRVLEAAEYPQWDAFVESSPQGTIFGSSLWAAIVTQTTSLRHAFYGCFKGQELVGGTSVFYRSLGPFRLAVVPPLTRYTGVLIRDQSATPPMRRSTLEEQVFDALSARLGRDFRRVVLSNHYSLLDIRPAQRLGWRERSLYTYLSDLTDVERLWASVDGGAKRLAAKAEKLGVTVRQGSDIGAFHILHAGTLTRQGVSPPIAEQATRRLYERLSEQGRCKLLFAENGSGQLCAAAFVVWDSKRAYYLIGASDERLRGSGAFSLLLWRMLEDSAARVPEMDLFGANIPSIAQFKKDFATRLTLYHDLVTYSSALIEGLDAMRLAIRRVGWRNWGVRLPPQARRLPGQ